MSFSSRLGLGFGVCLAGLALAACGSGGGALPAPAPCETLVQRTPLPGEAPHLAYEGAVLEAKGRLIAMTSEFFAKWPSRRFSRSQEFREDLVRTADRAACLAAQLRSLTAPDDHREYDRALDDALTAYEADMRLGREAAEDRNVSKFREWLEAVDALPGLIQEAEIARP